MLLLPTASYQPKDSQDSQKSSANLTNLKNLAKFANYPHLFLVTKNQSPKTASMANMAAAEVDDIAAIKPILQDSQNAKKWGVAIAEFAEFYEISP